MTDVNAMQYVIIMIVGVMIAVAAFYLLDRQAQQEEDRNE